MKNLPPEILSIIFAYYVDPYELINNLMVWRQINLTTFAMVEDCHTLSVLLLQTSIRDTSLLRRQRIRTYKPYGWHNSMEEEDTSDNGDENSKSQEITLENQEFSEIHGDDAIDSDDDSDDEEALDGRLFYPSHCFIDRLLHYSRRNQHIGSNANMHNVDWKFKTQSREFIAPSEMDVFDDAPQFHDKVEQWIDSYSEKKSWIVQLLLEISLGREMIEYLGSSVGFCIVHFFHKLFEPAIQTISKWNDNPKTILDFSDIFNRNMYDFLEMAMKKETILRDEISTFWFEMEAISNFIPRQVILFIAENFSHINIKSDKGEEKTCSVFVFEELRKFGICVEKLKFIDNRSKLSNYDRSPSLNAIIPDISSGFYLQHFSIWINSIPLLEWCLNVDSTSMTKSLVEYFESNHDGKIVDVSISAHAKTYLVDHALFSILHYAVWMNSVEMVDILVNKYMACPSFSIIDISTRPIYMVIRNNRNKEKEGNNANKILEIISSRYGAKYVEEETNHYLEMEKLTETAMIDTESRTLEGDDDSDYDHEYYSDDIPLFQDVVVEDMRSTFGFEIIDDLSDDEYEEGLDYNKLTENFLNLESECNNVLKRKRFDPLAKDDNLVNYIETTVKNTIAPFESNTWDSYLTECGGEVIYNLGEETPKVKILARSGIKKRKLENELELETAQENPDVDNELLTTRYDSCEIIKKRANKIINEIGQDYKCDLFFMPNARMLMQQYAENLTSQNCKLAKSYSQVCYGMDSTMETNSMIRALATREIYQPMFAKQCFELDFSNLFQTVLGEIGDLTQLSKDIFEAIQRFESITNEDDEEEDSEYLDNVSTCSSDSMTSNICQVELSFQHAETYFGKETCYSSKTLSEYEEINSELFHNLVNQPTNKRIVETHKLYDFNIDFTTDREEAVEWLDHFN